MSKHRIGDFRTWNMPVESFETGRDAQGLPYFVWRESADNRLGLGRPRYCCIEAVGGELNFVFFDPSNDGRSSQAVNAFLTVAGLIMLNGFLQGHFSRKPSTLPYHLDMTPPPFLVLVSTALFALFLGLAVSVGWYAIETLAWWLRGRVGGGGHTTRLPWASLQAFQVMNAVDTPAGDLGEKLPPSSYGLGAVFDDGSHVALTANPWNFASIAGRHRRMTALFITERAETMRRWKAAQAAIDAEKRGAPLIPAEDGVPGQL